MNDCIFCKIINGEIPSYKVYEDDNFYAFLDITQVTKGHTLVIPKEHIKDIFELSPQLMGELYQVVNKLAKKIVSDLDANGVNILNNNKEIAGQTVFHYHVHIIPRYDLNDKIEINFNESDIDIDKVYEKISK